MDIGQSDTYVAPITFHLRTGCSNGINVKRMDKAHKDAELFQVSLKNKGIPFGVFNLGRRNESLVNDLVWKLNGRHLLEIDACGETAGLVFCQSPFVSDSIVEVPGPGEDVFYRYTVCLGDEIIIVEIHAGELRHGQPEICFTCRRMRLYLPDDFHREDNGLPDEIRTERMEKAVNIDGRKETIVRVDLFPLRI